MYEENPSEAGRAKHDICFAVDAAPPIVGLHEHVKNLMTSTLTNLLLSLTSTCTVQDASVHGKKREPCNHLRTETIQPCCDVLTTFDDVEAVKNAIVDALEKLFSGNTAHKNTDLISQQDAVVWKALKEALESALNTYDCRRTDLGTWSVSHAISISNDEHSTFQNAAAKSMENIRGTSEILDTINAALSAMQAGAPIIENIAEFRKGIAPLCIEILQEANATFARTSEIKETFVLGKRHGDVSVNKRVQRNASSSNSQAFTVILELLELAPSTETILLACDILHRHFPREYCAMMIQADYLRSFWTPETVKAVLVLMETQFADDQTMMEKLRAAFSKGK
jgi:hypothetical protein